MAKPGAGALVRRYQDPGRDTGGIAMSPATLSCISASLLYLYHSTIPNPRRQPPRRRRRDST